MQKFKLLKCYYENGKWLVTVNGNKNSLVKQGAYDLQVWKAYALSY